MLIAIHIFIGFSPWRYILTSEGFMTKTQLVRRLTLDFNPQLQRIIIKFKMIYSDTMPKPAISLTSKSVFQCACL